MHQDAFIRTFFFMVIVVFTAISCSSSPAAKVQQEIQPQARNEAAETFVYECHDLSFIARTEGSFVLLFLPGKTLKLPRTTSASGVKYADKDVMFWAKGDQAMLNLENRQYRDCRNNHAKAVWEHAKLNGVDFRAVGNEPGWMLELRGGGESVLVTDYGENRYNFTAPPPETVGESRLTIYRVNRKDLSLFIKIEGRQCNDTMSDEVYACRVTVQVGERSYRGCGRALH